MDHLKSSSTQDEPQLVALHLPYTDSQDKSQTNCTSASSQQDQSVAEIDWDQEDKPQLPSLAVIPPMQLEAKETESGLTPHLSLVSIFILFLKFGLRAWGGPMAQIAMIKEELVVRDRWITMAKFNRILAVYQALPGPEATELCCYFGFVANGRVGSVIAGTAFMLPGLVLILLLSFIYTHYGINNNEFNYAFKGIQPVVAALVVRATHKIGEHAMINQDTGHFDMVLFLLAVISAFQAVLRVNFLITLVVCGFLYSAIQSKRYMLALIFSLVCILTFGLVVGLVGMPSAQATGTGLAKSINPGSLFLLGLLGGSLTFGGAYTAIPFIQQEATELGQWMTKQQFLDGIALASILPAPLVIFSTFVGYFGGRQLGWGVGGELFGGLLTTFGMFLPAFSFTVIGHKFLERIIEHRALTKFLDGVSASVVGLVAITAIELIRSAVVPVNIIQTNNAATINAPVLAAIIFIIALQLSFTLKHRFASTLLIFGGAIVGQYFFVA